MSNLVFSGIQPSGQLHIGNSLGAIINWLELQEKYPCIFAIVDYHSISVPFNPQEKRQEIKELALDFLALGINPKKSQIIIQSHLPEHLELAWILGTITPLSWLERIPTFKSKKQQHQQYLNLGLLSYPVLMSADILLYKANLVPVGEDQLPHIELTNQIAKRFNQMFGKTFPEIKPILTVQSRIMGLNRPNDKMSKSLGKSNYLALTDLPKTIRQKIKSATTDSDNQIKLDWEKKPGISNLLSIYHLFTKKTIDQICQQYQNKGYAQFKSDLAEIIIEQLSPFQNKRQRLSNKPGYINKIISNGEKKAKKIAQATLREVKQKIGLL